VSRRARLGLVLVVTAAVLSGCGSSSSPAQPPSPYDWRAVNSNLWEACTPIGDRVYAYEGSSSALAVVPAGCR
jgi:predicted component of type VI protein secretion system